MRGKILYCLYIRIFPARRYTMTEQLGTTVSRLPVLQLRGLVAFPNMIIHFDVGRLLSIRALEAADEERSDALSDRTARPQDGQPVPERSLPDRHHLPGQADPAPAGRQHPRARRGQAARARASVLRGAGRQDLHLCRGRAARGLCLRCDRTPCAGTCPHGAGALLRSTPTMRSASRPMWS